MNPVYSAHECELSDAQSGIWIAQGIDPASPAFNIAEYVDIRGPLRPDLFSFALRQVVNESDCLRLRISSHAEGVRQFVEAFPADTVRAPLIRQPRPERIPLSYAQRRLWFIDQLEGSSAEYNMPQALRLRGRLDLHALQRAIDTIVERHESLRTHFAQIEGEPIQIIEPPRAFDLPIEDLSGLHEEEQRDRALEIMRREWEEPFNLATGPVLRMKLIKVSESDHVLLRNFHHIVSDGWSQSVFNREFMLLYESFQKGRENLSGGEACGSDSSRLR